MTKFLFCFCWNTRAVGENISGLGSRPCHSWVMVGTALGALLTCGASLTILGVAVIFWNFCIYFILCWSGTLWAESRWYWFAQGYCWSKLNSAAVLSHGQLLNWKWILFIHQYFIGVQLGVRPHSAGHYSLTHRRSYGSLFLEIQTWSENPRCPDLRLLPNTFLTVSKPFYQQCGFLFLPPKLEETR